ncbi:MAG: hypothetical protein J6Z35_10005, partial [Lachnospiraceae bacterium]|nr:hypothetical protein [Lachnospiraceae bacterium]
DNAKENMKNQSDHLVEGVDGISAVSGQIRDLMTDGEGNTKKPEDLSDEDVEALAGLMRQLMNYVSDTGVAAGEMAGDAGTIARVTTPYTKEAAENAGEDLDRLSEDAHRMNASLQAAGKELQGIINYLNALDRLQAVSLSSNFDKNADQLKLRLDNISDLLDQLDQHTYVHSEKLEDDMRALNDKMNEILHLMVQKLERLENFVNGEDVIEDHSALDSESREAAGITDCTNEGIVNADSNAGGIAGSIGVERADTEDGKRFSVGNKYIARAVLEGCVNKGFITVKNEKAGGIAGNAELGYLKNCNAAGRVRSEDGSYLGGIAGVCSGRIESCGAAAVLTGKAYIGGIAGQAKEIYSCCAIPEILKAEDYVGAIAGKEKESGEDLTVMRTTLCEEIKDNYYVSSEYYGINGVSYVGAAEPVTYEKLLEKAADSSIFQHLYVTFIDADEKIIQKREMEYGADLQYLQYPDVYTPDGDYMEWEGFSGKRMEGNIVIQAVSTSNVTILSGKNGQGSKPIALAAGVFTEAAQIRVSEYQGELPAEEEPGEVCHAYRITLENTDLDKDSVSRIRLLREEPGKALIYRMEQGEWVKTESKSLGSYEEVEMKGTIGIYCIVTNTRDKSLIPVIGISLAGVLAITFIISKIKAKNEAKKPALSSDE